MDEYVTFRALSVMLGFTRVYRIYDWDARGCLPTVLVDGGKCVPVEFANKLADLWSKSCTPIEAAKALGIGPRGGSIGHLMEREVLKTIEPFGENFKGYARVMIESIPTAKRYIDEQDARKRELGIQFAYSGKGHRFTSEEAGMVAAMRWAKRKKVEQQEVVPNSLVLYVPKSIEEIEIVGQRKLITPESAAKFLDVPIGRLENLGIRGEYIGEMFLPYAHSLEVYKSKQKNGKKKP